MAHQLRGSGEAESKVSVVITPHNKLQLLPLLLHFPTPSICFRGLPLKLLAQKSLPQALKFGKVK